MEFQTTGLADPGNIAPLFWVDDGLGSTIYLDGIVTVVDAKNILKSLDEGVPEEFSPDAVSRLSSSMAVPEDEIPEAYRKAALDRHAGPHLPTANMQVSHADVIVVNKSDLVTTGAMDALKQRLRAINGLAQMQTTTYGQVPRLEGVLLDLHAYDNVYADQLDFADKGHSHLDPVSPSYGIRAPIQANIDEGISTIAIPLPALNVSQLNLLDAWLRSTLWESLLPNVEVKEQPFEVHRSKGRILLTDGSIHILQGVREIFELAEANGPSDAPSQWPIDGSRPKSEGKLVFIGKGLVRDPFEQSLYRSIGVA
jgi:G3E family GTPase